MLYLWQYRIVQKEKNKAKNEPVESNDITSSKTLANDFSNKYLVIIHFIEDTRW